MMLIFCCSSSSTSSSSSSSSSPSNSIESTSTTNYDFQHHTIKCLDTTTTPTNKQTHLPPPIQLASSPLQRSPFDINDDDDNDQIYDWWPPTTTTTTNSTTSAGQTSQDDELPAGVPRGLVNLGNTCYMNASLQSLYSIESFRNLVTRNGGYDKLLTSELADLFKCLKSSQEPISPANFKRTFSKYQSKFSGLGQQDAQEFLRYLINGIHEESNKAARRPRRSTPPEAPKSAQEAWAAYRDIVDDSPFVDLVVGQMCSTIVCCQCQNKSNCWDPFWDLSLPLVRGRHSCKLSEVLQDFIAKETLDSDERPICSQCKRATRSTKQIHLSRLPQLIILHLKKFTNDGYKMTSPEVRIDRVLNLENGTSYQLQACISHHGHSSSSGHYTSHCKYSSKWFHFNDDR